MAAEARVRLLVELEGLGPGVVNLGERFTHENTPDKYRRVDAVISTTATLLSSIVNIPSAEVLGLAVKARGDDVYVNTISTAVSTAGCKVPENECNYFSYMPGNSCVITLQGEAADSAVTMLIFGAAT